VLRVAAQIQDVAHLVVFLDPPGHVAQEIAHDPIAADECAEDDASRPQPAKGLAQCQQAIAFQHQMIQRTHHQDRVEQSTTQHSQVPSVRLDAPHLFTQPGLSQAPPAAL